MNAQGRTTAPEVPSRPAPPRTGAGLHGPTPRQGPQPPTASNGAAVAAWVVGITALATSIILIGGPLGVIGLVLGVLALRTAKRTGVGRAGAITGVVASCVAIVLSALMAVFFVWYADNTQECYQPDGFRQYTECVHHQLTGG